MRSIDCSRGLEHSTSSWGARLPSRSGRSSHSGTRPTGSRRMAPSGGTTTMMVGKPRLKGWPLKPPASLLLPARHPIRRGNCGAYWNSGWSDVSTCFHHRCSRSPAPRPASGVKAGRLRRGLRITGQATISWLARDWDELSRELSFGKLPSALSAAGQTPWDEFVNTLVACGYSVDIPDPGAGAVVGFETGGRAVLLERGATSPMGFVQPISIESSGPSTRTISPRRRINHRLLRGRASRRCRRRPLSAWIRRVSCHPLEAAARCSP